MTENKIKPTMEQTIYCLKAESERYPEVCEECQLYGEVGCDHCYDDVTDVAIQALEEIQQYRAIGTVEEFKTLKEKKVLPIATVTIDKEVLQKLVDEKVKEFELDIKEIRAMAIDEFAEALKEESENMYGQKYVDVRVIDEIAEQMKEGGV